MKKFEIYYVIGDSTEVQTKIIEANNQYLAWDIFKNENPTAKFCNVKEIK
jgi:hypothetical protein